MSKVPFYRLEKLQQSLEKVMGSNSKSLRAFLTKEKDLLKFIELVCKAGLDKIFGGTKPTEPQDFILANRVSTELFQTFVLGFFVAREFYKTREEEDFMKSMGIYNGKMGTEGTGNSGDSDNNRNNLRDDPKSDKDSGEETNPEVN